MAGDYSVHLNGPGPKVIASLSLKREKPFFGKHTEVDHEGAPLIEFPCCQGIIHLRGLSVRAHWERIEVKEAEIQGREGKLGDSKSSGASFPRGQDTEQQTPSRFRSAGLDHFPCVRHPTCQFRYLGGLCHTKKQMSA